MEDEKIIDLFWDRNHEAIAESDRKYGKLCRGLSRRILGNAQDAEECVNDTWFCAWNAMPPDRPDRLSLFLAKIARNLSLDKLKAKNRIKRGNGVGEAALEELGEVISGGREPEQYLEDKMVTAALNQWLRGLSPEKRIVFLLRYWDMESIKDIAEKFNYSEGKVTSLLHRLRNELRTYLTKEGVAL